jgi:hypothetical protein
VADLVARMDTSGVVLLPDVKVGLG